MKAKFIYLKCFEYSPVLSEFEGTTKEFEKLVSYTIIEIEKEKKNGKEKRN